MPGRHWTNEEVEFLDRHYADMGAGWIAERIDRTIKSVSKKAYFLRIHRVGSENLVGKKFGKWTVISKSERRSGGNTYWRCRCECGNEADVQRQSLRHSKSTQCLSCANEIEYCGRVPCSYLRNARNRALRRSMEFDITMEEISELYESQDGLCALSALPIGFFDSGDNNKSKSLRGHTASLDRIDSTIGYIADNVQWVHRDINAMKNLLDQELFVHLCHCVAHSSDDRLSEDALAPSGWMQHGCSKGHWSRENG